MTRILLIAAALICLNACDEGIQPGQTPAQPNLVKGLRTMLVVSQAAPARFVLPGTIESSDRGMLTARIAGQVARIHVSGGQSVQPGDTLLSLIGETASSDLAAALAGVAAAQARLAEAETNLQLAETTYTRFVKLSEAQAVTPHEFDKVKAERDIAAEKLGSARASLAASRAQQKTARTMADQVVVRAPYAGTVVELLVDAGSTVLPGAPLLNLDRSGVWQVRVALPESLAVKYHIGDSFAVEIPTMGKQLDGRLAELLPTADPVSRTVTAKLNLAEDNSLYSGLFARVLTSEGPGTTTLMVPLQAVVTRGQLTGVYVVEDDILHYRMVQTGLVHADQVEILSGLGDGEEIVAADIARAHHGARLERAR